MLSGSATVCALAGQCITPLTRKWGRSGLLMVLLIEESLDQKKYQERCFAKLICSIRVSFSVTDYTSQRWWKFPQKAAFNWKQEWTTKIIAQNHSKDRWWQQAVCFAKVSFNKLCWSNRKQIRLISLSSSLQALICKMSRDSRSARLSPKRSRRDRASVCSKQKERRLYLKVKKFGTEDCRLAGCSHRADYLTNYWPSYESNLSPKCC